jgi:phosphonate transport system substrate-binding protein
LTRLVATRRQVLTAMVGATALATPALSQPRAFTLALTPVLMISDLDLMGLLRSYLATALGMPVQLATRRSYQDVTVLVMGGKVDAAWVCGFPYVMHRDLLDVVAVPIWRGSPLYQSYLIVEQGSEAQNWSDLEGHLHAFSDPDSNSGYLVTAALLARNGRRTDSFFQSTMFTYEHRNVVRAVAAGLAQSGSVDGYIWDTMADTESELADATRVLRRSEPLGFPPVVVNRTLGDPGRSTALRDALLSMASDDLGRSLLAALRLDGFTEVPSTHYDAIAAHAALVRSM